MLVQTRRFGELDITDAMRVHLPAGLLGFEQMQQYALYRHDAHSPFRWLQSLDDPELAFVVIDPFDVFADYDFEIAEADVTALQLSGAADVDVLTLVTITNDGITCNLVGPIVINRTLRQARQLVLTNSPYGTRHTLPTKKSSHATVENNIQS